MPGVPADDFSRFVLPQSHNPDEAQSSKCTDVCIVVQNALRNRLYGITGSIDRAVQHRRLQLRAGENRETAR